MHVIAALLSEDHFNLTPRGKTTVSKALQMKMSNSIEILLNSGALLLVSIRDFIYCIMMRKHLGILVEDESRNISKRSLFTIQAGTTRE